MNVAAVSSRCQQVVSMSRIFNSQIKKAAKMQLQELQDNRNDLSGA
jgi:hypothetical protein